MGYSPWGHKELDTTEQLTTAQHIPQYRIKSCFFFFLKIVNHSVMSDSL